MSALISMSEVYRMLKEKSLSIINTMSDNKNNNSNCNSNSDNSVKHNEVFEHNLRVLIELCDQKLNNNNNDNNSKSDDNEDDYESNDNAANIDNEKFIVKVMSNEKNDYKYKCGFSNECVNTRQHNCGKKRYKCNENNCSFVTASNNYLNKHTQSVHSNKHFVAKVTSDDNGINKYKCTYNSECNKQFIRKQYCLDHINTHTGQQPYKCERNNCHYKSAFLNGLRKHVKLVHSIKKFVCDWSGCGYKCSVSNDFVRHKRTHTGEKPFECDWNGCAFRTAYHSTLVKHKLSHIGEKQFKCHHRDCEFKTVYSNSLRNHIKNIHLIKARFDYKTKLYGKEIAQNNVNSRYKSAKKL